MGLFDNLFKSKPLPDDDAVVEAARRTVELEQARLREAEAAEAATPKTHPPARHAPAPVARAYSPRSLGQVVAPHRPPEKKIRLSAAGTARPGEIRLVLGDVLPRIPPALLNDAPRDPKRELHFQIEHVTADIARGRAEVHLSRIAEQVPEIFHAPVTNETEAMIRLPLQKLVEQIGFGGTRFEAIPPPPVPVALPPPIQRAPTPPPAAAFAFAPGPVPAPAVLGAGIPRDAKVALPLAAVLKNVPPEMIVSKLPPIAEEDRLVLPFGPLEQQLESGEVSISAVRFVFSLPPHLQSCFDARDGSRIILPLDEVHAAIAELGAFSPATSGKDVTLESPAVEPQGLAAVSPENTVRLPEKAEPLSAEAGQTSTGVGQTSAGVGQTSAGVGQTSTGVGQISAGVGQTSAGVGQTSTGVGQTSTGVGQTSAGVGQTSAGVGQTSAGVGQTSAGVGQTSTEVGLTSTEVGLTSTEAGLASTEAEGLAVTAGSPAEETLPVPAGEGDAPPAFVPVLPPPPIPVEIPAPFAPTTAPAATLRPDDDDIPAVIFPGPHRIAPPPIRPVGEVAEEAAPSIFPEPPGFPMQPPVPVPAAPEPVAEVPHIEPPPSPILPVRVVAPPPVRPFVAPPPLFGGGHADAPAAFIPVPEPVAPPPPPPPPPPLDLAAATAALGLPSDAPLSALGEKLARLPGLHACLLAVRHETADCGALPAEFDAPAARALAARLAAALGGAGEAALGEVQHVTVFAADGCLSVFARGGALVGALHKTRAFLPGVRETLAAATTALAEA